MDSPVRVPAAKWALLIVALSPVVPQLLGSAFNIWYNIAVVDPLLFSAQLKHRFIQICAAYNSIAYPAAIYVWLRAVYSLRPAYRRLWNGEEIPSGELECLRRCVIHLPWRGALVSGVAWILCIPIFLIGLAQVGEPLDPRLIWHLPTSFLVSAFISVTHSFFLVELASHRLLFPAFFKDTRPDETPGAVSLSIRGRGVVWAISAGICPIGSLLLLSFAPPSPGSDPQWFAVFVGSVGIAFGLCTAVMITRLVAEPIDHLRTAAQSVARGNYDVEVPLRRADEFGLLIGEFNHMIRELREKERLRRTFGLHVGRRAAEQILARDPGLGGVEQEITVMFVDIRSFTQRSVETNPAEIVAMLNEFLKAMVEIVEGRHGGMINKFLGDGFIALFGVGEEAGTHADTAVAAGEEMIAAMEGLNQKLEADGRQRIAIGVGVHSGPAVVGSIGSPDRLEFTAIGSTVNMASRIEGLTKSVGTALLLTEETRRRLRDCARLTEFPPQPVRGVPGPVRIFGLAAACSAPAIDGAAVSFRS